MPVPTPDSEAPAAEGWTYSYTVESPALDGAAPAEASLGEREPAASAPEPAAPAPVTPTY
jgi:hypothetical protein